jgi:hypothetical protein
MRTGRVVYGGSVEVRVVTISSIKECPFSGTGMVLVWTYENMARLVHPITLDEWTMPIRDHLNQQGVVDKEGLVNSSEDTDLLWPINQSQVKFSPDRLVATLRHSFQRRCLYGTCDGSIRTLVRQALSELQGILPEAVDEDLNRLEESTRSMPKPRGVKPPKQITMEGNMAAKKKASNHRDGITYVATQKLDPEKFRGQRQLVSKALGAFSTPKDLETIVKKVESNGGYKVAADGGTTDSVHFHLRELVKSNLVKEIKEEETVKKEPTKKEAKLASDGVTNPVPAEPVLV